MLSLKNIVKEYGEGESKVEALKGVSLDFRKSEFVSILGPSGCGKTTMLNIIGGLDRYTSGDLIISGKSTKNFKDSDWDAYRNDSVGFVFQSYNLIPHQTVLGNVELALTLSGVGKAERRRRALEVLKNVGLGGQANKRPNQLSGGQMQRVAIARALVNDPEIILADEPTGALDTETSVQILDLLKEVAKDRLVIMVTHNAELAKKYSTRIINLLDGEKTGDSNPYDVCKEKDSETGTLKSRKTKMSWLSAFILSLSNLRTKKARTALTSFAGSIGIIGIALVLALSNGFSIYMSKMQTDTLSTYPLSISAASVDLSSLEEFYDAELKEKYPELDNVAVRKMFNKLTGMLKQNRLSEEFLGYLNAEEKKDLYYSVQYDYGFDMNDFIFTNITLNDITAFTSIDTIVSRIEKSFEPVLKDSELGGSMTTETVRQYIPTIIEMPDSNELISSQYDLIYGNEIDFSAPDAYKKMYVVVDKYNRISDITLALLGYKSASFTVAGDFTFDETEEYSFKDIVGKEFYFLKNDDCYTFNPGLNGYVPYASGEAKGEKLEIAGILRQNPKTEEGILQTGLAYTAALTRHVLEENKNSQMFASAVEGVVQVFGESDGMTVKQLGGDSSPSKINIYAKNFECKEEFKAYIDSWNDAQTDELNKITYSDMMSMIFSVMNTLIDAVSYVLISFTAISLVVSSIMIGIITYVSVVERTKEIGVLRSLGARKRDISNVFNAETFLIGIMAGLLGVAVAYLVSIPVNLILNALLENVGRLMSLRPLHALILVIISFGLTLIAGLIPASIAAKKDPVIALRTE